MEVRDTSEITKKVGSMTKEQVRVMMIDAGKEANNILAYNNFQNEGGEGFEQDASGPIEKAGRIANENGFAILRDKIVSCEEWAILKQNFNAEVTKKAQHTIKEIEVIAESLGFSYMDFKSLKSQLG